MKNNLTYEKAEEQIGELKMQLSHYNIDDNKKMFIQIRNDIIQYETCKRKLKPKHRPRFKQASDLPDYENEW